MKSNSTENCENPLKPVSLKVVLGMVGFFVALLMGWWVVENVMGYQITTKSQANAAVVGAAMAGREPEGRGAVSFSTIGIGVGVVGLAALLLTWRNRDLVQNGQRVVASVVKAKTVHGVRVVTISYSMNGKTKTRKLDLHGVWADQLDAPQMVDIIATDGFFTSVHVLGCTAKAAPNFARAPQTMGVPWPA